MSEYVGGCVTGGSYFTYKGVRYGECSRIRFKKEFYESRGMQPNPKYITFYEIKQVDGHLVWQCGYHLMRLERHSDVVPDRDIEEIVTPIYYYEPKELVKKRLKNGSWIIYIWPQTLIYILCLIISPLFKEGYLMWTTGLLIYLRICYVALSKGELYRGW